MKHLKTIGLALLAAAAFMAFAGSASAANTLTSPSGTTYFGAVNAELAPGTSLLLSATFSKVTCTQSTATGEVTTNNATEASGPITTLTFGNCGSNDPVVKTLGTLSVNPKTEVFSSGTVVTVLNTPTGADCAYGGFNVKIGPLDQSTSATTHALQTVSASLPYNSAHSSSSQFICGNGTLTATYTVTKPVPLFSV